MADETKKKRRVLFGIVAGVLLIGVVGVTIALAAGGEESSDDTVVAPGAALDPKSVEGICRSEGVVKFDVAPDPKAEAEFTATGAAEPWVGKGETSQTTNVGEDEKLVAISREGQLPRVVLTVAREDGAWAVTTTAGCLDAEGEDSSVCWSESAQLKGDEYPRDDSVAPTSDLEVGRLLGNGTVRDEANTVTGDACEYKQPHLVPRGTIAPVSIYEAVGNEELVLVQETQGIRAYTR